MICEIIKIFRIKNEPLKTMLNTTPPSTPKNSVQVKQELNSPDTPYKGRSRKAFKESRDIQGRIVISLDTSESEGENEWRILIPLSMR